MGGAFGGKESQATIIAGIAALLAWKTRRAGEAAAAARRRHARDRQAPSVPDPLRRRLRRRGPHACARPHAGRQRRQRRRPHAGGAHARALPRRQLLLAAERPLARPAVQDQHRLEHRLPRLRRAAGHAGDRDRHRGDRAPARPAGRHGAAAELLRHRPQRRDALRHDGRGQHHRARASTSSTAPSTSPRWRARRSRPSTARAR